MLRIADTPQHVLIFMRRPDLLRQHRQAHHRQAVREKKLFVADVVIAELIQEAFGLFKFTAQRQQHRFVKEHNFCQFKILANAELARLHQMYKRIVVFADAKFAQPQHGNRRANFWIQRGSVIEGFCSISVLVFFIKQRSEIPPTFIPLGLERDRFFVQFDGVVQIASLARLIGLGGSLIELLLIDGGRALGSCGTFRLRKERYVEGE